MSLLAVLSRQREVLVTVISSLLEALEASPQTAAYLCRGVRVVVEGEGTYACIGWVWPAHHTHTHMCTHVNIRYLKRCMKYAKTMLQNLTIIFCQVFQQDHWSIKLMLALDKNIILTIFNQ